MRSRDPRWLLLWLAVLSPGCGSVEDPCTLGWVPVAIVNPSFDEAGGWTGLPENQAPICRPMDTFGIAADSGESAACFGLVDLADQTLAQTLTLPDGAQTVELTGKRCFVTSETEPTIFDTLEIGLEDPDTHAPLKSFGTWTNRDATTSCRWGTFGPVTVDLDAPVDRVEIVFHGRLDDGKVTSFLLDTLSVRAWACLPSTPGG